MLETFYFTFGVGHKHTSYCQPIQAETSGEARAIMFALHGSNWASIYSENQFSTFEEKYGPKKHLIAVHQGGKRV